MGVSCNLYLIIFTILISLSCSQYNYLCDSSAFSKNTIGSWNYDTTECSATGTGNGAVTWLGQHNDWIDYTVECTVRITSGSSNAQWAGIIFRAQSIGNNWDSGKYYAFFIVENGNSDSIVFARFNNNWNQIRQQSQTISQYTDYILKAKVSSTSITVYVNGQQKFVTSDSNYIYGSVGLRTYSATVKFTNLTITGIPTPQPTPSPSNPTSYPTPVPTTIPTKSPITHQPTNSPITNQPTNSPITDSPTKIPTNIPTKSPTLFPTTLPTKTPSETPITKVPTETPTTKTPTETHSTKTPTQMPNIVPENAVEVGIVDTTQYITANGNNDELVTEYSGNNIAVIIGIVIGICGFLICVTIVGWFKYRQYKIEEAKTLKLPPAAIAMTSNMKNNPTNKFKKMQSVSSVSPISPNSPSNIPFPDVNNASNPNFFGSYDVHHQNFESHLQSLSATNNILMNDVVQELDNNVENDEDITISNGVTVGGAEDEDTPEGPETEGTGSYEDDSHVVIGFGNTAQGPPPMVDYNSYENPQNIDQQLNIEDDEEILNGIETVGR
eukprot:40856_1